MNKILFYLLKKKFINKIRYLAKEFPYKGSIQFLSE
jgi:hypothetical protein